MKQEPEMINEIKVSWAVADQYQSLIKELDGHKNECATSLLSSHATYILLQKNPIQTDDNTPTDPPPAQFTYTALLERIEELFPDFRLHMAEMEDKALSRARRSGPKTPSPAGRLLTKQQAKKNNHRSGSHRRK
ncbi:uncharacterized protein LOC143281269 isoform X2 [Babylonia areolata]|uniref:uncharacterized protein LOC143281269 isoform X2 n=1 Tax=Babylonia areolata TaxID=304850 RepID=UPI003FD34D79